MLNKVILTGKLGRDPHAYFSQEGKEIVTFSLATTQSWKDEAGEWHSATDWHNVTVFRESTIKWIKDVLKRGHKVYVEGKLTYQHWTDTFGQRRLTPHVVITGREGRVEEIRPPMGQDVSSSHQKGALGSKTLESKTLGSKTLESKALESKTLESKTLEFESLEFIQNSANSTSELNPEEKIVSLASEKANEETDCLEVLEEQVNPKN